jgi:putative restriction endonuclease
VIDTGAERLIRTAAMNWLDARPTSDVDYAFTRGFEFEGVAIPLMDRGRGIRKPKGLEAAISISTAYRAAGQIRPYEDVVGADGLVRYKYEGTNPDLFTNRALRRAMELRLPIIWFVGVANSRYEPLYPVWVVGEEPDQHQFALALDSAQLLMSPGVILDSEQRRYSERLTRARLHQRVFRAVVLLAYDGRCTVCALRHSELLDAAHIIGDGEDHGDPVVTNGLAMCKIHHAAFDSKILGIRPNLTVHVRQDILEEVDGPMLKHGIQERHDQPLMVVPSSRLTRPDVDRLEQRYAEFLTA